MRVQRREATDVLTREGETALLIDGQVVRLGELGSATYELTEEPIELTDLARQLEDRFGAPVDRSSWAVTKDAVADLVHHGVLRHCD